MGKRLELSTCPFKKWSTIDGHEVKGERDNKNWKGEVKGGCNEEMSGFSRGLPGLWLQKTLPLGVFIPDMAH